MKTGYSRLIFKDQCYVSYCIYASHHIDVFLINFPYVRLFTPTYKLRLMMALRIEPWTGFLLSTEKNRVRCWYSGFARFKPSSRCSYLVLNSIVLTRARTFHRIFRLSFISFLVFFRLDHRGTDHRGMDR